MCNTMQAGDVMQLEPVSAAGEGTLSVHACTLNVPSPALGDRACLHDSCMCDLHEGCTCTNIECRNEKCNPI